MHAPEDTQPGTPDTDQAAPLWVAPDTVAIGQAATQLREAMGRAVVQLGQECTVYLLGGPEGRAQVDELWRQREVANRARRQRA